LIHYSGAGKTDIPSEDITIKITLAAPFLQPGKHNNFKNR
jgi:hypothetical protein